jgi:hypothetical protein
MVILIIKWCVEPAIGSASIAQYAKLCPHLNTGGSILKSEDDFVADNHPAIRLCDVSRLLLCCRVTRTRAQQHSTIDYQVCRKALMKADH